MCEDARRAEQMFGCKRMKGRTVFAIVGWGLLAVAALTFVLHALWHIKTGDNWGYCNVKNQPITYLGALFTLAVAGVICVVALYQRIRKRQRNTTFRRRHLTGHCSRNAAPGVERGMTPNHEQQFAVVASALEQIARRRNLLIERYYKDRSAWDMCFSHPAGGQAKVEVHSTPDSGFMIVGDWWVDDYDAGIRRIRNTDRITVERDEASVRQVVDRMLEEILQWTPGEWTREVGGFERFWHRYSRADFKAMAPQWPAAR